MNRMTHHYTFEKLGLLTDAGSFQYHLPNPVFVIVILASIAIVVTQMMADQEAVSPIRQLPFELMCTIFDHLDIDSVTNCSLVCRQWKEIIFSDYYIKRFVLQLQSSVSNIRVLEQSDRLYRHVDLKSNTSDFNAMYSILCYPKLKQYLTFKARVKEPWNHVKMITDAIGRMKVLRELYLVNTDARNSVMKTIQICSDSLQLLSLDDVVPAVIKAPYLKTLVLQLFLTYAEANVVLYSYRFPHLKSMKLSASGSSNFFKTEHVEHALSFFAHLTELDELILTDITVNGYIFKAICGSCTNLTKLHLDELCIVNNSTMSSLSNLTKLRELKLQGIYCLTSISFLPVTLPHLDLVAVGDFQMQYETLRAFSSATRIGFLFGETIPMELILAIASQMPRIRQVELPSSRVNYFQSLILLPKLEALVINKCSFEDLPRYVQHPIDVIKELCCPSSVNKPDDRIIALLLDRFPNLKLLKYGNNLKHQIA
ncbi:uncharacterized protein LOC121590234 [Anopheles merus]|uniref:uncharacterized protein LOC121590234 n=1 Tax=Anopheles merus TaxID=30066 RepID=UPI001BE3DF8D|nr:uncharacterized protein LOC121590234 [Anopheles merus]